MTVRVYVLSGFGMLMKALWLVVVLVKQPSFGVGEVGVIVYVRARAREREIVHLR